MSTPIPGYQFATPPVLKKQVVKKMEDLPPELLYHVLSFDILNLSDYKAIRSCGSRRLETFFRPVIFQHLTVTWKNLVNLGYLMGVKSKDVAFYRATDSICYLNPPGGQNMQLDEGALYELIQRITASRIAPLIRHLTLVVYPVYPLMTKDTFKGIMLPPGRTYGSQFIDEFFEHYQEVLLIQRKSGPSFGSFGHRALCVALAGGFPYLSTVEVECCDNLPISEAYAHESWTTKIAKFCSVNRSTGWAIMYTALKKRTRIMSMGTGAGIIEPVEEFHLKNTHPLSKLQIFDFERADEPRPPRSHIRINDWTPTHKFPLEFLTKFSAEFHPAMISDSLYLMSLFRPWTGVMIDSDSADNSEDNLVPAMTPWTMQVRAMRNLKHLHLGMILPEDQPPEKFPIYTVDPLIRSYRASNSESKELPIDLAVGLPQGQLYEPSEIGSEIYRDYEASPGSDSDSTVLDLNGTPGPREQEMESFQGLFQQSHSTRYLSNYFIYDKESDREAVGTEFGDDADVSWPQLQTFSLSNFRVAVPSLRYFLNNHKTVKNVAFKGVLFCQFQERDLQRHMAAFDFGFELVYASRTWVDEIRMWSRFSTWLSQIVHFTTLNLQNVCLVNCLSNSSTGSEYLDEAYTTILIHNLLSRQLHADNCGELAIFASKTDEEKNDPDLRILVNPDEKPLCLADINIRADEIKALNKAKLLNIMKVFSCVNVA